MRWRTNNPWRAGIAFIALLFMLLFIVWLPASVAGAHERGLPRLAGPGTVTVPPATPTVDATVAALNKEKLTQEIDQQQRTLGTWLWSNTATLLSAILSTFVVVIGALFGFWRWRVDRRDTETREAKNRSDAQDKELEDRAEERFQAAVVGLGDDKEGARIGAAILLRTFLREGQGYEQFYVQTFDLAVANLRLSRSLTPDPNDDTPTTLSQALIVAFKEAFPLAREWLTKQHPAFTPQMLDATGVQLDNAYLSKADLKQVWMPQALVRKADLSRADLTEAHLSKADLSKADLSGADLTRADLSKADLSGADLRGADLSKADLRGADLRGAHLRGADLSGAYLHGADLRGAHLTRTDLSKAYLRRADLSEAKGLTAEQRETYKAKGAIINEDAITDSPQPTASPAPSPQSSDSRPPLTPPTHGNNPAPDADSGGSTTPTA